VIALVYGTTAELIKLAPVYRRLEAIGAAPLLWCTGQQYDELPEISERLGIPQPDVWLGRGVKGRSLSRTWDVPPWMWHVLREARSRREELEQAITADQNPPMVMVHGDTMTTVVGALLGRWLGASVAHIEAGLRSHNIMSPFPEELDRRIAAQLSDVHFTPGADKIRNLRAAKGLKVDTVGNTVVDSLALVPDGLPTPLDPRPEVYGLASLHRYELMRTPERLTAVLDLLANKAQDVPIYFVTDAVSSAAIADAGLSDRFGDPLVQVPKLPYFEFVTLLRGASFVITDSGGLQEECAHLNLPCLVHRGTTERPDGLGRNVVLSGMDLGVVEAFLADPARYTNPAAPAPVSPSDVIVEHLVEGGYVGRPRPVDGSDGPVPELSVIVPAYREVESIRSMVSVLIRMLDQTGLDYEVLVVSDGNLDGTQYEASAVSSDRLTVLHYAGNAGKAFALRYGLNHARADTIAFIDVDLSLSALGIRTLYQQLVDDGCDIVVGSKFHTSSEVSYSPVRSVQQTVFGGLVRAMFDLPVLDTQTGLRVFRRKVLDDMMPLARSKGFGFDVELLYLAHQAGYSIEEGPIHLEHRLGPVLRPSVLLSAAMTFVRLAWVRLRFVGRRRPTRAR
jgi:UDP-N-acetylglucosamine 2-epimerase (non-hydrolysing)